MNIGDRVIVEGKQVFEKDDQPGTVIAVFTTTVKVLFDNGRKFFVVTDRCKPHIDHM